MQRLLLLLALLFPMQAYAADELVINGSTTVLPIVQKVAESYMAAHPGVDIALSGGGSGNGMKALIDGLATIAMSSRDIKSSETELAVKKGIKPVRIPVAVDALVPVVHPQNPVSSLSLQQFKDIYAGRITNWKELGGADANIVVISRDTSSGTYETWESLVMKSEKVMPKALLQASNGAVVQIVAKNRNALGYVGIGYMTPTIKGLHIGDLVATPESALSRQWPLARELYLFTNGQPTGVAGAFVKYLLDPAKGQKAVREAGFVPLVVKEGN
ncbi:MAG: phosphate ABC transporter substrate-binding protein [Bilophila sp.]